MIEKATVKEQKIGCYVLKMIALDSSSVKMIDNKIIKICLKKA